MDTSTIVISSSLSDEQYLITDTHSDALTFRVCNYSEFSSKNGNEHIAEIYSVKNNRRNTKSINPVILRVASLLHNF